MILHPFLPRDAERHPVMLHVNLITLQENNGENHCRLNHDNWLHPDSARRLSCDASMVTVLEKTAKRDTHHFKKI